VFLEGCTVLSGNRILVLTWRERKLFEFSFADSELALNAVHAYPHEGWGITYNPEADLIYTTDGSDKMYTLDPATFKMVSSCQVTLSHDGVSSIAIKYLNELEYIGGKVFGNIYIPAGLGESPNYIVGIDPTTCMVETVIPLFGYTNHHRNQGHVMNGITEWPLKSGELAITGKKWDIIIHINLHGISPSQYRPAWKRYNITRFVSLDLNFR